VHRRIGLVAALMALVLFLRFGLNARAAGGRAHARDLITTAIDDNHRVTLRGNTRPEANRHNDRGRAPDDFKLHHLLLQLRRPAELQQEFDEYVDGLTRGSSSNFHQWLAPAQVGDEYGLSDADLLEIKFWLRMHGIRVNYVYPNRVLLDISANARQVREAFHTDIHFLEVDGVRHYANMNDPEIPAALAPAVAGIVAMHDFQPHSMLRMRPRYTFTDSGKTYYSVTPPDLAAIYNLNPLFSQGITGAGQTIAIVEDTDPFTLSDWTTFETKFQLTKYGGSVTLTHPDIGGNCGSTTVNGDDGELALDIEYAAAAAPGAALQLATCTDVFVAIANLVMMNPHPYIISVSYNACEPLLGSGGNAFVSSTFQMAAGEGISIFVSSGDEGPDSCDSGANIATHGISVGGLSSTPFNVSVGGTDFIDTFNNSNSTYWTSSNSSTLQSANGYIPEIPWDNSCGNVLVSQFYGGTSIPYGSTGFCNTTTGKTSRFRTLASGSGGPSSCGTGDSVSGTAVDGTCAGYLKPTWQSSLFGNPNDGVRDQPDVSLFASNGNAWNHFYIFCWTDMTNGGAPCTGNPDPFAGTWSAAGGTSFAAPILAGIQALVNQRTSALTLSPVPGQGNPNPVYYAIAKSEYGASGSSVCNSSNQPLPRRGVSTACVFYDVTQGDIDLHCTTGSIDCFGGSGTAPGVLVTGAVAGGTFSGGSGYSSAPACSISAPHNSAAYNGYTGGVQATCTATISGGSVNAVTLNTAGAGYAPFPLCSLTGGGGSGAACTITSVTKSAYQPSFPATPGWDFATGIGTINAYNLVFSPVWAQGP